MATQKFTPEQVISAIQECHGMVSIAARLLGCKPGTVRNYALRYATVREAIQEEREAVVDIAELKLIDSLYKGESWAISLVLKTLGKKRGYVERQEMAEVSGTPIGIKIVEFHHPWLGDKNPDTSAET